MAALPDRELSGPNTPETRLDATAGSCQAERRGTNQAGLAKAKSSIPTTPGHSYDAVDAQGNIELMPEKEVLEVKPAPRPEQVGNKHHKQLEDRKHRSDDALILRHRANPRGWNFSGMTSINDELFIISHVIIRLLRNPILHQFVGLYIEYYISDNAIPLPPEIDSGSDRIVDFSLSTRPNMSGRGSG